jgi:hypothetical protein
MRSKEFLIYRLSEDDVPLRCFSCPVHLNRSKRRYMKTLHHAVFSYLLVGWLVGWLVG